MNKKRIVVAPSDGIDCYDKEMKTIYAALKEVMGTDFSDAMVTDESYITDFLTWDNKEKRLEEKRKLTDILGLSMDNPSLVHLCRLLRQKGNA